MSITKTGEEEDRLNESNSKSQILKSTAIFGSAQVIIVIAGIIRTKVLALLLGPAGVGISGVYQSTIDLIKAATGFGLGYGGVRDIAAASASGDTERISKVVTVLKRWAWATGILGLIVTIAFSRQLSQATFGDTDHAIPISILSVCVLLSALATFRSTLLQGFRRIPAMAKSVIWASLGSLAGASVIYYLWGIDGIIPAIILVAVLELTITWLYSKNIQAAKVPLTIAKSFTEGKTIAKLGFFITASLLASTASMYFVRSFIVRENGLAAVGYFIAAWTISSLYISAIFNAMGADFFPRLSSLQDDRAMVKMVNEQTEVGLLLTMPVIIVMISFIDLLVGVFYTREFSVTANILSWQLAGDFFKVLSWPLGFLLLAKGKGAIFLIIELVWNLLFCSFVYFIWDVVGIEVTGVAFLVAYVVYLFVLWVILKRVVRFQWTSRVWKTIYFFLPVLCLAFLNSRYLHGSARIVSGCLLTIFAACYSYLYLRNLINLKSIVSSFRSQNVF
jgi:O-antigen/teichoic acid export membrane protein